jgi:hypothetical protein
MIQARVRQATSKFDRTDALIHSEQDGVPLSRSCKTWRAYAPAVQLLIFAYNV